MSVAPRATRAMPANTTGMITLTASAIFNSGARLMERKKARASAPASSGTPGTRLSRKFVRPGAEAGAAWEAGAAEAGARAGAGAGAPAAGAAERAAGGDDGDARQRGRTLATLNRNE